MAAPEVTAEVNCAAKSKRLLHRTTTTRSVGGTETGLLNYNTAGNTGPPNASNIFSCPVGGPDGGGEERGPERYIIPSSDTGVGSYLYFIAWADEATSQGSLAQLKRTDGRGKTVYTGQGNWQVCATGQNIASGEDPAPTQEVLETEIAKCNAGSGSTTATSAGWVDKDGPITAGAVGLLAVGEDNSDAGGTFPITCQMDVNGYGIDAQARWMWYNWDPANVTNPFFGKSGSSTTNPWKDFLIFRIPLQKVVVIVD